MIPTIGRAQSAQVTRPLVNVDNCRWISMLKEHEVQDEAADAPVAVDKRMDSFQPCMMERSVFKGVCPAQASRRLTPLPQLGWNGDRERHINAAQTDPSRSPPTSAVPRCGRLNRPHELHREAMDLG